ncbi:hypothetical protein MUN46_008105 [Mesosutterella sp. AGMB02718]|uniref:Uncharacterized protein n=1 Tax=Mesosutterella faecium TaxID=2925194 RepID=A0ABT7IND6_9BURK|nr:hypothetical protein [Mesosutterella sp. AGMB02718]MDL2059890.1 hypothetical protein [Mesosutterella sp. AGMB02718]
MYAWLIEELPHGRVRILPVGFQKGPLAKALHEAGPEALDEGPGERVRKLAQAASEEGFRG